MIFATLGTQLPFDRFLKMLDEVVPSLFSEEIVAQAIPDNYIPRHFHLTGFISPADFEKYMHRARIVVAHAGMGTIISALKLRKPIVLVPRRLDLGEIRTDHQIPTAIRMERLGYTRTAHNTGELKALLTSAWLTPERTIADGVSLSLVRAIMDV